MKIKISETATVTEIEASAQELRESNTMADNMQCFLRRIFRSHDPIYDEPYETDDAEEEDTDE